MLVLDSSVINLILYHEACAVLSRDHLTLIQLPLLMSRYTSKRKKKKQKIRKSSTKKDVKFAYAF